MKRFISLALAALSLATAGLARAEVVVIANPSLPASSLSAADIAQFYLGRTATLADGSKVVALDQAEGSAVRTTFVEQVLGKNEQQYRSYWTRLIFTGKGQPPRVVASSAEVVDIVANTPGAVGYVDAKDVSTRVKVLYRAK